MKTLAKTAFIGYLVSRADANAAAAEIRRARASNNFFYLPFAVAKYNALMNEASAHLAAYKLAKSLNM